MSKGLQFKFPGLDDPPPVPPKPEPPKPVVDHDCIVCRIPGHFGFDPRRPGAAMVFTCSDHQAAGEAHLASHK